MRTPKWAVDGAFGSGKCRLDPFFPLLGPGPPCATGDHEALRVQVAKDDGMRPKASLSMLFEIECLEYLCFGV